ncbi:MAG: hypothetical protein ACSHX6_17030 [Akkermansiaceae bacterium]
MKRKFRLVALFILPLVSSSCATNSPPQPSKKELAAAKPYPLDTCLVIDRPLSETKRTYTKIYKGQQVKFCCTACIKAFEANPEVYMPKVVAP